MPTPMAMKHVMDVADEFDALCGDVDYLPCSRAPRGEPTCLNLHPYTHEPARDLCAGCQCAWHTRQVVTLLGLMARRHGMEVEEDA